MSKLTKVNVTLVDRPGTTPQTIDQSFQWAEDVLNGKSTFEAYDPHCSETDQTKSDFNVILAVISAKHPFKADGVIDKDGNFDKAKFNDAVRKFNGKVEALRAKGHVVRTVLTMVDSVDLARIRLIYTSLGEFKKPTFSYNVY